MPKKSEPQTVHSKAGLREFGSEILSKYREDCRVYVNNQITREIAHQEAAREAANAGDFNKRERMLEEAEDARRNIDCYKQEMIWCEEILIERINNTQLSLWDADFDDIPF